MPNIKEIVLEAGHSTVPAYWLSDEKPIACSTSNFEKLVSFAEALIESYKDELLKEVGEPVAYQSERNGFICKENKNPEYNIGLFTSDQVAAAVLKATGPLEEEIQKLRQDLLTSYGESEELSGQLAKAEQRVVEYNELIYAVQTKHHDETRHQTALRYIRNAENRQSYTAANGASS